MPDQDSSVPVGWWKKGVRPEEYAIGVDRTVAYQGQASGFIKSCRPGAGSFDTLMQACSAADFRGQRVRMSSYVKAALSRGQAQLWMRVDGPPGRILSFDAMEERPITGTSDWTPYDLVLDVPEDSDSISFGLGMVGEGQAWIDAVTVEPVGPDVRPTDLYPADQQPDYPSRPTNLDFEE